MYNLKRSELQAVLAEVTAVTHRVTNQLNTLTGFAVTDYMAEGDDTSAAGDMFLPEQMDVLVQSLLTVIGTGVESDTGVERMQTLASAFHEGGDTLRVHYRKHRGKLRILSNKNIMRDLVSEDIKSWAADLFGAAVAALEASRSPRQTSPTWTCQPGPSLMGTSPLEASNRPPTRGERVEDERSEARGSSGCCRVSGPMLGVVKVGRL